MNNLHLRSLKCLFASLMVSSLTACAVGGIIDRDSYPVHTFSFDTLIDSPDVEVLDYQYSNSRHNGVRANPERIRMGQDFGGTSISGSILRGDFLYVKWRVKKPGVFGEYLGTYEDRVDLRSRLPADINNLRIHFIIRGVQLYVYLIWSYDPNHDYPANKKSLFTGLSTYKSIPIKPNDHSCVNSANSIY